VLADLLAGWFMWVRVLTMLQRRVLALVVGAQLAGVVSCTRLKPDDPPESFVEGGVSDGGVVDASNDVDAAGRDDVSDVPTIWNPLGDGTVRHEAHAPFALLASTPHRLDIFVATANGALFGARVDEGVVPGSVAFEPILPVGSLSPGHRISAISSIEEGMTLFWVKEGTVMSAYIDPREALPRWSSPFALSLVGEAHELGNVVGVTPVPGGASIFWPGPDGTLRSSYYDPWTADPRWVPSFPLSSPRSVAIPLLAATTFPSGAPLVAYTTPSGAVRAARFDLDTNHPVWLPATTVTPNGAVVTGSDLGLVSTGAGQARLACVGHSGDLRVASFSTRAAWSGWSEPTTIVPAGAAKPGGTVAGVIEGPAVHWFYETPDNSIARVVERLEDDSSVDHSTGVRRLAGSRRRRPDTGFAVARRPSGISVLVVGADGWLQLGSPAPEP